MEGHHPTFAKGKICYLEIPALDPEVSARFYESVFGWNIRTRSNGDFSFDDGANEVSGTWRTDRKVSGELTMLVHLMVFDIEEAVRKVIEHGGKIVQPVGLELPEITARFTDPAGNLFGLFQQ